MYKVDNRAVHGDTTNMLLSNISEQLSEIIMLLKPHEVKEAKEEIKESTRENVIKCPKCGITELRGKVLTKQTLSAHIRFCKGV